MLSLWDEIKPDMCPVADTQYRLEEGCIGLEVSDFYPTKDTPMAFIEVSFVDF